MRRAKGRHAIVRSQMSEDDRQIPRFIVGMSRSGTTWVGKSMNRHPEVAVFGETQFWGKNFVSPGPEGRYQGESLERLRQVLSSNPLDTTIGADGPGFMSRIQRSDIPALVDGALNSPADGIVPAEAFRALGNRIAADESKKYWIEKTSRHVNWADRILEGMPDARFVTTIREPYSFMLSYKHQADRGTPERRLAFSRRYHPLGCAILWRTYIRAALRLARRCPEQVLLVRLAEIQREPERVLERVQDFLLLTREPNLEPLPQGENTSFRNRERPELPSAERFWVNLIASKEIAEAGFERQAVGGGWLDILKSVVTLPLWAIRAYTDLDGRTEGSTFQYILRWLRPR